MERELHRLENKVAEQAERIRLLEGENHKLKQDVATQNGKIKQLREKLGEDYPEEYITNDDTIKTLEAKLSTTTW